MRFRKWWAKAFAVFIGLSLTSLPGCWSRKEIDSLGYVTMAGVDLLSETREVMLTVHIAKPFAIRTEQAGGSSGQEKSFWTITVSGETLTSAARELFFASPRRPFWGHCRVVFVGEELARRGLRDVLDWLERNGPVGRLPDLALVKGAKAGELLQAEFSLEKMPTQGYVGILESVSLLLSRMGNCSIVEVIRDLEEEGREAVIPAFEIVPVETETSSAAQVTRERVALTARLAGAGVLKEDKLVGWLGSSESRAVCLAGGLPVNDFIELPDPKESGKKLSVHIVRSEGRIEPVLEEGISFRICIRVQGRITGVQREFKPAEEPAEWAELEQVFAGYLKDEVEMAVSAMQSLGSDVFGFGASLRRKNPREWEKVRGRWDELFRILKVEAEVDATLLGFGISLRSISIR